MIHFVDLPAGVLGKFTPTVNLVLDAIISVRQQCGHCSSKQVPANDFYLKSRLSIAFNAPFDHQSGNGANQDAQSHLFRV